VVGSAVMANVLGAVDTGVGEGVGADTGTGVGVVVHTGIVTETGAVTPIPRTRYVYTPGSYPGSHVASACDVVNEAPVTSKSLLSGNLRSNRYCDAPASGVHDALTRGTPLSQVALIEVMANVLFVFANASSLNNGAKGEVALNTNSPIAMGR
jgi:hypothetical protein